MISISVLKKTCFYVWICWLFCITLIQTHIVYLLVHWTHCIEWIWSKLSLEMDGHHQKQKTKYSIIVPTYNERLNIGLIVYLIFKHLG